LILVHLVLEPRVYFTPVEALRLPLLRRRRLLLFVRTGGGWCLRRLGVATGRRKEVTAIAPPSAVAGGLSGHRRPSGQHTTHHLGACCPCHTLLVILRVLLLLFLVVLLVVLRLVLRLLVLVRLVLLVLVLVVLPLLRLLLVSLLLLWLPLPAPQHSVVQVLPRAAQARQYVQSPGSREHSVG
jgi:hypothetical protein